VPVEHERPSSFGGIWWCVEDVASADGFDEEGRAVGCRMQAPPLLFVAMGYPHKRVPSSVGLSPGVQGESVCDGDYEVFAAVRGLAEVPELPWAGVGRPELGLVSLASLGASVEGEAIVAGDEDEWPWYAPPAAADKAREVVGPYLDAGQREQGDLAADLSARRDCHMRHPFRAFMQTVLDSIKAIVGGPDRYLRRTGSLSLSRDQRRRLETPGLAPGMSAVGAHRMWRCLACGGGLRAPGELSAAGRPL
jgi:hypothetical protein